MGPRVELEQHIRFGKFKLDPSTRELWRDGQRFSLQEQPFQILNALLERPGQLVSRDELRKRLWSSSTFVDFEHGLNKAMNRLRDVLEDSAEHPIFIETLPRRGYRFIATVERVEKQEPELHAAEEQSPPPTESPYDQRSLTGRKVSHYRVLGILGGGGMGVVYKAEDLKLGRSVALKFLPEELGKDGKAIKRFEREARAVSALDHPNICAIHEFGEHDGQPFMVMPLLEGHTLRDQFAEGVLLSMDKLLDIAVHIACGLEAAHQKGIIHRDIKPANIFVTARGEAKIFDFGLAKLAQAEEQGDPAQQGRPEGFRADLSLTRTGVALGTAAYMSPEQVRGEKLDARSDLFSFGLVLYEMATGCQAFTGNTAPILHDAILNRTPASAKELNPEIPSKLETIINKALEKDRTRRYQSTAQMRADLERLRQEIKPKRARTRWVLAVGGLFGLMAIVGATFWHQNLSSQAALPEVKQRQLTSNSSENAVVSGAISPDGKYLAYADLQGMHIKLIDTGETRNVAQPDEFKGVQVNWGIISTWVRDGTRFIANAIVPGHRSSLWVVPATGGAPRKLRDDAFAGSVSRDGSWVAFASKSGRVDYREMWLMRPDGGQAWKLYEAPDEDSGFTGAEWSPHGQRLSYSRSHQVGDNIDRPIESRDLKGGPATTAIADAGWDWSWLPDGRMVFVWDELGVPGDSCNFWAQKIAERTGKPVGNPKRLTSWAGFCMDHPSPTADGRKLAFRRWAWQGSVYIADLQANGTRISAPKRLTLSEGKNYPAAWTADSKALVFGSYRDGRWQVLKQSPNDDAAEPIAPEIATDMVDARVSPRGDWILYTSVEAGPKPSIGQDLMRARVTGGPPELVLRASTPIYGGVRCARAPATLCAIAERTSDRKQLVFTAVDELKGAGRKLARFDIDPSAATTYSWDLSPGGNRLAVLKYSDRRISVLPLDGGAPQQIAVKGWDHLQSVNWATDGRSLFASSVTEGSATLLRVNLRGDARMLWEQKGSISPSDHPWDQPFGGPSAPWAIPSPDGRHLAIYSWSLNANMWMMENF
jgi:eukaryotic-like serine/threonine-protein kinase